MYFNSGFIPFEFDRMMCSVFSHVFSIPILMIAMTYTKNIYLIVLQILSLLTGTLLYIDNINIILSRPIYSKKDDINIVILLGIIMIPEIATIAMFGSIMDITSVVVCNMLLVIFNAMADHPSFKDGTYSDVLTADSRRKNMLEFWYDLSSIKSFGFALMSLYLVINNSSGNINLQY
jgi:hypothetical protein